MIEILKRTKTPASVGEEKRILLVEDDVDLTRLVRRAASMASSELGVDVAHTGENARERLRAAHYDFVLLDNFLDGQTRGVDLVDLVRKTQPGARIALMSAMDPNDLAQLAARKKGVQILPKPFSAGALRMLLHEALDLPGACPAITPRLA